MHCDKILFCQVSLTSWLCVDWYHMEDLANQGSWGKCLPTFEFVPVFVEKYNSFKQSYNTTTLNINFTEHYIHTLSILALLKQSMQCYCCCFNLGQVGLVGAAQRSGLHMLWYLVLASEDMQGQPLSGWAQVRMNHSVCLCKGHGRSQKSRMKRCYTVKHAC